MAYKARLTSTGPYVPATPKVPRWKPNTNNGWVIGPRAPAAPVAPAAPPAAPVPAAPAVAPAPSVPAPDATYEQQMGFLAKGRDTTLGQLATDRTQTISDYGYTPGYDAAGNVTSLAFDPNNPYSRAALAKVHYDQGRAGNTTSMAARGQLYSGALQNAQNATDFGYGQTTDSLMKALTRFLGRNTQAVATAGNNYDLGAAKAYGDMLARAPTNPLYDPGGAANAPAAPAPAAAPSGLPAEGSTVNGPNGPYKVHYDLGKGGVWHIYPNQPAVYIQLRK